MDEPCRLNPRRAPCRGTVLIAFQLFNTYRHHTAGSSTKEDSSVEERLNRNTANAKSENEVIDVRGLERANNSSISGS